VRGHYSTVKKTSDVSNMEMDSHKLWRNDKSLRPGPSLTGIQIVEKKHCAKVFPATCKSGSETGKRDSTSLEII
jgi:hypothetical protein